MMRKRRNRRNMRWSRPALLVDDYNRQIDRETDRITTHPIPSHSFLPAVVCDDQEEVVDDGVLYSSSSSSSCSTSSGNNSR